jgi:hypothetical protein
MQVDNRASLSMTLAQSDYCNHQDLDPQDPPCGRVILSGRTQRVVNGSEEAEFAQKALFTRHPAMKDYPNGHQFYLAKLNIEHITLLAWYGGAGHVPLKDYMGATLDPEEQFGPDL